MMHQIDATTEALLQQEQREWLSQFWAGRSPEEVFVWQDRWLFEHGLPSKVQGPTGLVWGAE